MQSISIYSKQPGTLKSKEIKNASYSNDATVNGEKETLNTNLYVNQKIGDYRKCIIEMDEVVKFNARVFQKEVDELVVTNSYTVYYNCNNGTLACLANKYSADNIKNFFVKKFSINYNKKCFDLNTIMDYSNNVRRAQFAHLTIQTLQGSTISGNQVNTTDMYDVMNSAGTLSTVAVSYPFNDKEISFSVSSAGTIVLFSTLEDNEINDFLNLLEDPSM